MDSTGLSNWAKRRNKKSQDVRSIKADEKALELMKYKNLNLHLSNREISRRLGIPETTVRRLLLRK